MLAKFFGRFVQTAFDLSVGSFWEVFLKKIRYILSFSHTEQIFFGIHSEIFQQGRQKELSKVSITSGHWAKSFRPFFKKVLQGYQNCILRVYRNSLNKKKFLKKRCGFFFNFFGHWAKKFWLFINFFSMESSKVSSMCPWEHFEEKCFRKNSLRFQLFSDYHWK